LNAPPELRGASFGLRQSLDTIGAFLGPLLAIGLMWLTADHFQAVFRIAVIPAFLALGLIAIAVNEPERPRELRRVRMPLHRDEIGRPGASYWWVVAAATVFTLARFSEAFLILRAQSIGLPGGTAWHRLWHVQSDHRSDTARGKHYRRRVVGCGGPPGYFSHRGGVRGRGNSRSASGPRSACTADHR
jgi:MFS family permease